MLDLAFTVHYNFIKSDQYQHWDENKSFATNLENCKNLENDKNLEDFDIFENQILKLKRWLGWHGSRILVP